jgi:iron complex outermembrane receptor protein
VKSWFSKRDRLLAGTIMAGASVLGLAAPAAAQDAEEEEAIIVTGSRIARSDFNAESPVSVVTAESIVESGQLNLGEVLRSELAVGNGGFNQSSNLSGGGAQAIDLRNLGSDRVLNLINGRRVANFADSLQNEASDLGFIPLAMIDRVEVLRDGASAVYGADAVTGVVNVILRDDFEGLNLTGGYGISEFGDTEQVAMGAVMGASGDRGNVVLGIQYLSSELVPQRDRPDWALPSIAALTAGGVTNGSGAHPGGLFLFTNDGFNNVPYYWCTTPTALGGDEITNTFFANAGDCPNLMPSDPDELIGRYDYALQQSILNGFQSISMAVFGTYDITDNLSMFIEAQYANRQSESNLDANPIFALQGSPAFPLGWIVPASNPHNPFPGFDAAVQIRPTSTVGIRAQSIDAQSARFATGLQGRFMTDFDWELSYIWTEVRTDITTDATFNLRRAIEISDPAACAANPICTAALGFGNTALDVYRPGHWAQSEINYFTQVATSTSNFGLEGVSGYVAGDAMELPAGPLGVALGFDYRDEEAHFEPDAVTAAGESIANQTFATDGGFSVTEFFGEVNIPLLRDAPLARSLSLNLQGRWFSYSHFSDDTVWKMGLNWEMTDWLRVRATYGTAFRAPTLVDSFSGGTVSFDFIDDPCDADVLAVPPPGGEGSATRIANCTTPGPLAVPVGYQQPAAQLPVLAGGDLADGTFDLEPETADTYTVGLIIQPPFLSGLRASVDYWSIEVQNFIGSTDVETEILDPCYDSLVFPADPACATVVRLPNGNLVGLTRTPLNRTGQIETSGIDWSVEWAFDLGPGVMTLDHQGTFINDYNLNPGVGNYAANDGSGAIPEYRLNFGVDYDVGRWSFGGRVRHIPYIEDTRAAFDGTNGPAGNPVNYDGIEEHTEFDLRLGFDATDTTALLFGINNVTGEDPPYAFSTGTNTAPGLYGTAVVGRYFLMSGVAGQVPATSRIEVTSNSGSSI